MPRASKRSREALTDKSKCLKCQRIISSRGYHNHIARCGQVAPVPRHPPTPPPPSNHLPAQDLYFDCPALPQDDDTSTQLSDNTGNLEYETELLVSPHDYSFDNIFGTGANDETSQHQSSDDTSANGVPLAKDDTSVDAVLFNQPNQSNSPDNNITSPPQVNLTDRQPIIGSMPGDYDSLIDSNSQDNPLDIPLYSTFYNNKSVGEGGRRPIDDYPMERAKLRLILLLEHAGSPLYLYDAILAWVEHTHLTCGPPFFCKEHEQREAFMETYWKQMRYPQPVGFPIALEHPKDNCCGYRVPTSEKTITTHTFHGRKYTGLMCTHFWNTLLYNLYSSS